jgi:hypothetical protein
MTRDLQLAKRIRGDRFWSLIIVCLSFFITHSSSIPYKGI